MDNRKKDIGKKWLFELCDKAKKVAACNDDVPVFKR